MKKEDTTKDESINMTPPLQQKINQNGFTNSPPLSQIMPPIIVILSLIMTLVSINIQLKSKGQMVAFNLLLITDFALVLFLWYKATSIVPTCSIQLAHQTAIEKGQQFIGSSLSLFCQTCKTYINKNCFHCKKCRRCVQFFDHHCKWLNNCIGAKNYFEFYGLIITTFILLALCISLNASCLSQIQMQQNTSDVVLACSILTILIASIPCCWLLYLICLHTYLICTKKTTIQLIMQSRNKNQIKPKNQKNHVFKVTFTKDEVDHSVAIKKVMFPDKEDMFPDKEDMFPYKEEQLENSTETNHNLIRNTGEDLIKNSKQDKITITEPSIETTFNKVKSLPPIKKLNHSFTCSKGNRSLGVTFSPPPIKRY